MTVETRTQITDVRTVGSTRPGRRNGRVEVVRRLRADARRDICRALRAAGAIIFAKNNTPEFSMNRRSLNLVTRECLTPWDPELEYAMSIPPRVRYRPVNDLDDVFARYDLLACPVIVRPAFVAGEPGVTRWKYTEYTMIVNAAGYTAASVPAGFVEGLPVGLQLIAPPDREPLVLRAARALERARPWARHRPPIS